MIFYITVFDLCQGFCVLHVFQEHWSSKEKQPGEAVVEEQIATVEEQIFSAINKGRLAIQSQVSSSAIYN